MAATPDEGPDDDDNLSNALEFLIGSDPQDSASAPHPDFTRHGLQSVFSISLPELPGATSRFAIESSPDLQTWTTRATKTGLGSWTAGVSIGPALNGLVTATLESTDADPQFFYRLRASLR